MKSYRSITIGSWFLAAIVTTVAVVAWYSIRLQDGEISGYELYPLFGLVAFSLMWTHYVTDAWRRYASQPTTVLRRFFSITSWIVLVLILLHPGLFFVQLWLDGFGLPPGSYLAVYTDMFSRIALTLGSLGLIAFLAFELHRRYKNASWWRYVEYANVAAMFAIFYHALTLGGELNIGWYRLLWLIYGLTLAGAIGYNYYHKFKGGSHE